MTATLPTLFISHGSPMHALEPGAVGEAWAALGRRYPHPQAILIVSAHWETRLPMVTGNAKPETIHDFFGFPAPLYAIRYAAPGAPGLAARAQQLLKQAGYAAAIDATRGLDHGAWSPLLHSHPDADVPVLQVSLQTPLGARHHLQVGRALAPLADDGVLIIGSGQITHNLRERRESDEALPYVLEFQAWVKDRLESGAIGELTDYRSSAPHAARAHPTEEHFMPLFVALGAAGGSPRAERVYGAVENGVLAMDTYRFHRA